MGEVITLTQIQSPRDPLRRIYRCIHCSSFNFKIIEIDGEDHLGCANCETWINEFQVTKNTEIE
jgi:transcription elongation factor Elf1